METYNTAAIEFFWQVDTHEDTCATKTYDIPMHIQCEYKDLPSFVRTELVTIAEAIYYYDNDGRVVAEKGLRSGKYHIINPDYIPPVCDCNIQTTQIRLEGCESTFIEIKPKGEE